MDELLKAMGDGDDESFDVSRLFSTFNHSIRASLSECERVIDACAGK
jgi:hypothetical protein